MLNHTSHLAVEVDQIRGQLALLADHVQKTAVHLSTQDRQFLKDVQRDDSVARYKMDLPTIVRLNKLAQLSPFPEVRTGVSKIFTDPQYVRPMNAPELFQIARESGEAVVAVIRDEKERTPASRASAIREMREAAAMIWAWLESALRVRAA